MTLHPTLKAAVISVRDRLSDLWDIFSDLLFAYVVRVGLPSSLGAAAVRHAEGEEAHRGGEIRGPIQPASYPPQGVPRPDQMVQVRDLLGLIAGEKCSKVHGGARCWEDPHLSPNCEWYADKWCDACVAQAALDVLPVAAVKS